MLKDQILSIINEELIAVIRSGSMSAKGRFWIRDESKLWVNDSNVLLTEVTAKDLYTVSFAQTDQLKDNLTQLAVSIMTHNPLIIILLLNSSHYSKTVSITGDTVKPYVDDIAQIIGIDIKNYPVSQRGKILKLFKSRSAVAIQNEGILCSGLTPGDAAAAAIIAEKAALIHVQGSYLGKVHYIGRIESALMRFIYRRKYSKQAVITGR